MKKVYIASDHGGYALKKDIIEMFNSDYEFIDLGCNSEASVDYPQYGRMASEKAVEDNALAIVICGTGLGISMVANKVKGARCALCVNSTMAHLAKEHNNANVLALGGRIIGKELARDIVDTFLKTPFSESERHARRISEIEL